jgi:hypothetical protein
MARSEAEYNALTVIQLKKLCKERQLVQKGVKKEIIDRLMQDDKLLDSLAANDPSALTSAVAGGGGAGVKEEEGEDIGIILGSPTKVVQAPPSSTTVSPSPSAAATNVEYQDETHTTVLFEGRSKYLSQSGLHFIANHQYRPSDYTYLDNVLNPFWTYLTECLPLWLAPNMVTTLGGVHCGLAYGILWYYCPDFDTTPPSWVIMLCAYCSFAYYTLDCMDGKQARRTGSSSPLGQLL